MLATLMGSEAFAEVSPFATGRTPYTPGLLLLLLSEIKLNTSYPVAGQFVIRLASCSYRNDRH